MAKQVVLYQLPEKVETARIFDDSFLQRYNDSIQGYNEIARQVLGKFNSHDGDLTGSNPFMLVHLIDSGLLPASERLAEREDLEKAIAYDNSFGTGNYIDFGLALKSTGDSHRPNNILAKKLAEQLKYRGIKLSKGKLLPFSALQNVEDKASAYGLVFELKEDVSKEGIRELSEFKWDYGPRDEGLARAYLNSLRGWDSDYRGLDYADSVGRVVVVSAEGTSQKSLDEYAARLEEERKSLETRIDKLMRSQAILRSE